MMQKAMVAFGLLLTSNVGWSATDLLSAWQAARSHDPSYMAEQAGGDAGSQKRQQARALWKPRISIRAGAGAVDMKSDTNGASFSAPAIGSMNNARFITDIHQGTDARAGLIASMPLYSPERRASSEQLELQSDLATTQLKLSDHALFLRVAQSYFDVLNAEDALTTLEAHKRSVQELLDIAKENFRVGKSASTDVHEAQATFDAAFADEAALQSDLEYKRSVFTDLTGLPGTALAHLRADTRLEGLRPANMQELIDRALSLNPEIQMRDTAHEIAKKEIEKHRLASSTTVDLVAQYERQRVGGSNSAGSASINNRNAWIGVQINVPLYTGGMRESQLAESLALEEKARQETDATKLVISQRVRSSYFSLTTGLQQIQAFQQGLVSAASKLDATQTGRELGARTTADVLNAQQAYYSVQSNLLRARYQVLMAALSLSAASGDLDVERLKRVNAFLEQ